MFIKQRKGKMPPKVTAKLLLDGGALGPPEVNTKGHNLLITKKLTGVSLVETIPDVRNPLKGKSKDIKILIPGADVMQEINKMHDTMADAEKKVRSAQERANAAHALGVRKGTDDVNALANKFIDDEQKKRQEVEKKLAAEKKKVRFAQQKTTITKKDAAKTKKLLAATKKELAEAKYAKMVAENQANVARSRVDELTRGRRRRRELRSESEREDI